MKNIRFALGILFLGSLAGSLTTCAGSLALNSIVITPANPSLPAGVAQQFTATGYYNDQTTHDITTQVTWSSSDTSVATVNSSGLATAIAIGTVTITAASSTPSSATNSGSSASTTLTVNSATLSSIVVTPANPSLPVGVAQQFTATGTYTDGASYDITTQVTWSSSATSVATVNDSGLATAFATGTATITATSGTIAGSTALTVNSAALSSITVTPANPSLPAGVAQQFTATGTYADGTSYDITTQVTWSSSDTLVATVNSSGLATAVAKGTATITATLGTIAGSTTLTVNSAILSSIFVTPANPIVPIGGNQQFTATGIYSDGTSYDITMQVTWSSSDTSVATVNSSGLATAFLPGSAIITATSGSISGSTTLAVPSG
jgi:uncharacterized protein YjdB